LWSFCYFSPFWYVVPKKSGNPGPKRICVKAQSAKQTHEKKGRKKKEKENDCAQ
jgi:hypothetical protein